MDTKDHLTSLDSEQESSFNLNPNSQPSQTVDEPVFPAELLDSGFEWTNILTG